MARTIESVVDANQKPATKPPAEPAQETPENNTPAQTPEPPQEPNPAPTGPKLEPEPDLFDWWINGIEKAFDTPDEIQNRASRIQQPEAPIEEPAVEVLPDAPQETKAPVSFSFKYISWAATGTLVVLVLGWLGKRYLFGDKPEPHVHEVSETEDEQEQETEIAPPEEPVDDVTEFGRRMGGGS